MGYDFLTTPRHELYLRCPWDSLDFKNRGEKKKKKRKAKFKGVLYMFKILFELDGVGKLI